MTSTFSHVINDFLVEVSQLPLEAGREDVNVALVHCFQFEQQLRHQFAQSRHLPTLNDDHYLGLINVFELSDQVLRSRPRAEAEYSFVWTLSDETRESFPLDHLLPLNSSILRPRGSRAIVPSLDSFLNNFEIFTHGALSRLPSWDNVVVAGGSVLGCLSPTVDSSSGNATNLELNELYQSQAYQDSDIDLFLYGLTHDEAVAKMHEIYESIRRTLPFHMVCVRRAHTITIYTTWPIRPIQIVMRLYMSPSEILAGFDIDSACCLYNGNGVYVNPRGLAAIICQSNTVHMSRRSPSYEARLVKYSNRGFEVYCPRLRRENIDYDSLYDPFLPSYPKGLAYLIVAEMERIRSNHYLNLCHGKLRVRTSRRLANNQEATEVYKVQVSNNYDFFRIPYREGVNALRIERMVQIFDKKANSKYNKINLKRQLHRHAVFAGTMAQCLVEFCESCPAPQSDEEQKMVEDEVMYIRGPARFINIDPSRQMIGSFNPITIDDWETGTYVFSNQTSSDNDVVMNEDVL